MKIGLYFGSFNPIHLGHLNVANYVLNETDLNKIWFIVSPQNPLKTNHTLLNEFDRLHLVQTAIEGDPRMKASDIEFYLPRPSYTVDTLAYLKEKYPGHEFAIIMGSDSFKNIEKWKNYKVILENHRIFIYPRPGAEMDIPNQANIVLVKAPFLDFSATHIRNLIRQSKSIRYMVPEKVREEIEAGAYYKNRDQKK
jgi:nicotinate-nucleotide adenylyltransferase